MNKRRVLWMVGGMTVAVAATSALAWWAWNGGRAAWWATASMWELDESQRAATEACGELDWLGSLRVLHQDQTVACEPSWFAHTVQPHLKGVGHRARVRWLQQVYADPASNERTRFRSGQALIVAGLPAPGFAMLTRSPTLHAARDELVQMVAEDRILPEGWADPEILSEAAVHELDDERAVVGGFCVVRPVRREPVGCGSCCSGCCGSADRRGRRVSGSEPSCGLAGATKREPQRE